MGTIITYTGKLFNVLNPTPESIDIVDIAHALAHSCRWGGHCSHFYSVAQHSVLTSLHVSSENALWGLLHDAAEAYLVDVPRPIKDLLPNYQAIEQNLTGIICQHFGLPLTEPAEVKEVDRKILATEAHSLNMHPHLLTAQLLEPFEFTIQPQSPQEAKQAFLNRFNKLTAHKI